MDCNGIFNDLKNEHSLNISQGSSTLKTASEDIKSLDFSQCKC